jgi:CO/xanthine dehydrogenase FAD-binding subunit
MEFDRQNLSLSFKPTEYFVVSSESVASDLLKERGGKARIIAGGTGIYEVAHQGLFSDVDCLVDISGLKLSYIKREADMLRLGAFTTMTTIFDYRELSILTSLGALYDALGDIQPLQVKNVATIGGAICTALPFFDLPVALAALDAKIVLAPDGRSIDLLDFVQGYFSIDVRPGEFVREIKIPFDGEPKGLGSSFQKFALTGDDWAIVNCGACVRIDGEGKVSDLRLCFGGGVGEKPARVMKVEKELVGIGWKDEDKLVKILEKSLPRELVTITDLKASSKYRMHLAGVLARRAITEAAIRANGSVS